MREILYRGKFGDEWKYGYLSVEPKGFVIKEPYELNQSNIWHIDPETVGQYTGLTDKNGTKIFEGDIVKCILVEDKSNDILHEEIGVITYEKIGFTHKNNDCLLCVCDYAEVIGNIHDNPELLEVKE